MEPDFDISDLGKVQDVTIHRETTLRVCDAIIPPFAFKTRVPWNFFVFDSSEECFKSQVCSLDGFLENLGIDLFKLWICVFPDGKHSLRLKVTYGSVILFLSILSQGKCSVVDPST